MDKLIEEIRKGNNEFVSDWLDKNQLILDSKWTDENLLRVALENKQKEIAKQLLKKGARIQRKSTVLHLAVKLGCLEIIDILLNKGAIVEYEDDSGETPITLAIALGVDGSIVDRLLSFARQHWVNKKYLSHLYVACMRNNVDNVKRLFQLHYLCFRYDFLSDSPMIPDWKQYTLLHYAVDFEAVEVIKLLINDGFSIIEADGFGKTPLHLAFKKQNTTIIDLILSAHSHFSDNPTDPEGLSHFHIACTRNDPRAVEGFLQRGESADMEVPNGKLRHPLNFAIEYQCADVVKLLLLYNATLTSDMIEQAQRLSNPEIYSLLSSKFDIKELNIIKAEQIPELHQACVDNDIEVIKKLIQNRDLVNVCIDFNSPSWPGYTPLHLAAVYGNDETIKLLLNNGADITAKEAQGKTPIHLAIDAKNDISFYKLLSPENVKENCVDDNGLSFFHIACKYRRLETVENFLKNGVNVNESVGVDVLQFPGYTALHFAFGRSMKPDLVKLLLDHGADITHKNHLGQLPLDLAFHSRWHVGNHLNRGELECIELLILAHERNNDGVLESRGITLFHTACGRNDLDTISRLWNPEIINKPIDLPYWTGRTPLHFAAHFRNDEAIEFLVDHGADVKIFDADGNDALDENAAHTKAFHLGLFYDYSRVNKRLMRVKENPISEHGYFHFFIALRHAMMDVVKCFLENGADVNHILSLSHRHTKFNGLTPLCVAARSSSSVSTSRFSCARRRFAAKSTKNDTETINLLLECGADIHKTDKDMNTALHHSVFAENEEHTKLLLAKGADVNARNLDGKTPLHLLFKRASPKFAEKLTLLLENGADINMKDNEGMTSLHLLCYECLSLDIPQILTLLLENGADLNIENNKGLTPFTLINSHYYIDNIIFLMKRIKSLEVAELYVNEKNKKQYDSLIQNSQICQNIKEEHFISECRNELEQMKNVRVDSSTSLYDILSKSLENMILFVGNVEFKKILASENFKDMYPIYGFRLQSQFKIGSTVN